MNESVPAGWELKPLGEFCFGIRGVSYKPSDLSINSSSKTITLLRSNNIQDTGIVLDDVQHVSCSRVNDQQKAQQNDIAVCMSNGSKRLVGKSASFRNMPRPGNYTVGAFCSIFRSHKDINPDFVLQLFQSQDYTSQVGLSLAGSAINNLKNSDVEDYYFLKPPLPEQQKIASILTSVDTVIEKTEAQINKLKDLKQAMMQELLTKGIGHTEFKDSPVGRIPRSWDVVLLDSVAQRGSGHTPNKTHSEYWNGGIKWVSLSDSYKLDSGYIFDTEKEISYEGLENSSAVLHPKGTVILSRDAGIGKSAVLGNEMAVSQHFIAWRCETKIDSWYLYYLLQYWKQMFESIAIGSTIKTIGLPFFKKLLIPYPSQNEQKRIASILASVDFGIKEKQGKLSHTNLLKKALMQDLLTGKVRVKV